MQGVIKKGGINVEAGIFTRDTALISGNQAINGLGFKPKAVIFFTAEAGTLEASWGIDDSIYSGCTHHKPTPEYGINDHAIYAWESAGNDYSGEILSLDNDGFTISWIKTGNPAGAIHIFFLAIG